MKKNIIFYPYLFALYPILGLYARNLTETPPAEIARPILIALVITHLLFTLLKKVLNDRERAAFLSGFLVFFFSASQIAYRVIEGTLSHGLDESWHRVLLTFAIFAVMILGNRKVWGKYLNSRRRGIMVEYFNYVAVFMLLLPIFNIGKFWQTAFDDTPRLWSSYVAQGESPQTLSAKNPPDIYYIILDGYGRGDVLQALYDYDNTPFLDELAKRGFYIADESQSNYLRTSLSVTSALNMEYINYTADLAGKTSTNRLPLFEMAGNSRARRLLTDAGYQFVLIDSGSSFTTYYDADKFVTPFVIRPKIFEMWFYSTTALNALYEPELSFSESLQNFFPLAGYSVHRKFITGGLENLALAPQIPSPKFVFAHMIIPHPPFLLGSKGEALRPNYPYVTGDGATFASNDRVYLEGYIGQVEFINKEILQVIDALLENSATPPVIIIQGDHGPGYLQLKQGDTPNSCAWERASILNAYYFPEQKTDLLYPSISPINSFRAAFNTYLNGNFALLEDKTFFSWFELPYNFTDITEKAKLKCGVDR
jgi:hypothetical protein